MDWQPDFAKSDPWQGMPKNYEGIATFKPTETNPLPPWESSAGALAAGIPQFGTREYKHKAKVMRFYLRWTRRQPTK